MDSLTEMSKIIDKYNSDGDQDAAAKALFDLIVTNAKNHDFVKAEAMRDTLFEIAPMALSEISRSGDIIDEEKSRSIDEAHKKIWSRLYGALTTEEANELYFALKKSEYNKGEIIFSAGDVNDNLYFIDSGEARMVYVKENEKILKIVGQGDIAGEDTFFYGTAVKTVSLVANSTLKLHTLNRNVQEKWRDKFPALEQKLRKFCDESGTVSEVLSKKGMSRRINKRRKLTGRVAVQFLNSSGSPGGKQFSGALCDISMSGLSFTFKLSNNDVAHKILGAKIKTQFAVPDGNSSKKIEQKGRIVGIGYHVLSDHSIHVRFDKADEAIKKLISA